MRHRRLAHLRRRPRETGVLGRMRPWFVDQQLGELPTRVGYPPKLVEPIRPAIRAGESHRRSAVSVALLEERLCSVGLLMPPDQKSFLTASI